MTLAKTIGAGMIASAGLLPAVLVAQSLPFHQRTGLWLIEMTMQGQAHPSKESIAFQQKISEDVRKRNACTPNQITHNADGSWSDTYTCTFADGKRTTTHSTFRGDFNTKFTATVTSGQSAATTSVFTYAGPCPPGMHGGDVEMHGRVMNRMSMFKHPN
jgi:hypothetical protein